MSLRGRLAGKKVLWHLNDTSVPGFILVFFRYLSRYADGFIFASERSRKYYENLVDKSKPQFVIAAPVDVSYFDPAVRLLPCDEELINRWEGKVVIGVVGNISRIKGLETFVRMAAEINRRVSDAQFVVIGPVFANQKSYFKSLRDLRSSLDICNLEFVGGSEDVRPYLKRFDIYVCSSSAESSPIAVWEAMSMALPVVSTDVGDVSLYVKDHVSGYVVSVGDYSALTNRVLELINDEEKRTRFGKAARKAVIDNLDIGRCASRHLEAYRAVCNIDEGI